MSKPKLNWFSPLPPTQSSIAFDTGAVLPYLAERAQVVLWTDQANWLSTLERHAEVRRYDPESMPWAEINAADHTFYHLGNHTGYHGAIWQVSRQHSGIVVLHDLNLQHFFAGLIADPAAFSRSDYLQLMKLHHGDMGEDLGEDFLSGSQSVDEICEDCPLTSAALENALGVAVHTALSLPRLSGHGGIPAAYVPLFAQPIRAVAATQIAASFSKSKEPEEPYRIIIFGFLGTNRRLQSVLEALRNFPDRHRFHLHIYGTIVEEESFLAAIEQFDLASLLTCHGFVDDAELDQALALSDLAINLRDPTMGEASASQLRIWQFALPSLITEIGWYATLPRNTVALVRRHAEIEDIGKHLREFLRAPELYRELGENGRRYAVEHHSVDRYLEGLFDLAETAKRGQPREAMAWVAGRAGQAIKPWFSDEASSILLPRVAAAINEVIGADAPTDKDRSSP